VRPSLKAGNPRNPQTYCYCQDCEPLISSRAVICSPDKKTKPAQSDRDEEQRR
jgi:hypothetical protein